MLARRGCGAAIRLHRAHRAPASALRHQQFRMIEGSALHTTECCRIGCQMEISASYGTSVVFVLRPPWALVAPTLSTTRGGAPRPSAALERVVQRLQRRPAVEELTTQPMSDRLSHLGLTRYGMAGGAPPLEMRLRTLRTEEQRGALRDGTDRRSAKAVHEHLPQRMSR
jgi:hypothetical protein